ncbi:MAG: hypothetical protein LBL93_04955 [Ruminococcus sp.]|jgi:hypothetical protein|nr:hypothetical protein [Ruminococcus sp.]
METRYVRLAKKYPRELVLLKAYPCFYGECKFCDYISDNIGCSENSDSKAKDNVVNAIRINHKTLSKIKGDVPLQVICSASFDELPAATIAEIVKICVDKNITTLIIESHWQFHEQVRTFKNLMRKKGIKVISLVGAETFNKSFRKNVLGKDLGDVSALEISEYFNWVNILFGIEGQTMESLSKDIDIARRYFQRINVNIFIPNSTALKRDNALTEEFYQSKLFCEIKDNPKFEILDISDKRAPDTFFI